MPKSYRISYIEGDGIGPEIMSSALTVLRTLGDVFGLSIDLIPSPAGDATLAKTGEALPRDSFLRIKESDLCLKAPVGETAKETIIRLRQELDLYANIRPAKNYSFIPSKFTKVDLVIVRENTEDLYVGREVEELDGKRATALKVVTERASKRIARVAFDMAFSRPRNTSHSVVCVQKSNVLPKTDGLFLRACSEVAKTYPSISFSPMYVDTAAMNLVRCPESFDVILTSNMYGDILSDEASQIVGGLGVAASANLGDDFALFEPVHGCAPDIAGKGIANPLSMMFTSKMMLDWIASKRHDKNCLKASSALEFAVSSVSTSGLRTPDIGGNANTQAVTKSICDRIKNSEDEGMEFGERTRGEEALRSTTFR